MSANISTTSPSQSQAQLEFVNFNGRLSHSKANHQNPRLLKIKNSRFAQLHYSTIASSGAMVGVIYNLILGLDSFNHQEIKNGAMCFHTSARELWRVSRKKIPVSTINYNLNKMIRIGLIEKIYQEKICGVQVRNWYRFNDKVFRQISEGELDYETPTIQDGNNQSGKSYSS